MVNNAALQFANGLVFFPGLALVVLALWARRWTARPRGQSVWTLTAVTGALLVAASATPLPGWAYVAWGAVFLFLLFARELRMEAGRFRRLNLALLTLFSGFSLMLGAVELPHHRAPRIPASREQPVYVLGDSLTAGMGFKQRFWPIVLADRTGLHVTSLALPGATTASALTQAQGITADRALVLVEIGGNDLLGDTTAAAFEEDLRRLLEHLQNRQARVVMFELPLPPFRNAYGRIQRRLSAEYGVRLIPKRYLTTVLGTPGGTVDSLHLSEKGQAVMGNLVADLVDLQPDPAR